MNRFLVARIALGFLWFGMCGCIDPARVAVAPPLPLPEHSPIPPAPTPPPPPAPPPVPTEESRARDQAAFEAAFKPFLPRIGEIQRASAYLIESEQSLTSGGFHRHPIRAQTTIPLTQAQQLIELLDSAATYSSEHAGCYAPGAGLSIEGTADRIEVVICLHCQYVDPDPDTYFDGKLPLSDAGETKLRELFDAVFPEGSERSKVHEPGTSLTQ